MPRDVIHRNLIDLVIKLKETKAKWLLQKKGKNVQWKFNNSNLVTICDSPAEIGCSL